MKKKKQVLNKKTMRSNNPSNYCNHCGGALKFSQDDVSCLMCGRNANHFCENCLTARKVIKKSAWTINYRVWFDNPLNSAFFIINKNVRDRTCAITIGHKNITMISDFAWGVRRFLAMFLTFYLCGNFAHDLANKLHALGLFRANCNPFMEPFKPQELNFVWFKHAVQGFTNYLAVITVQPGTPLFLDHFL